MLTCHMYGRQLFFGTMQVWIFNSQGLHDFFPLCPYIYMGFLRGTLLKGNYIIQTFEIKNPHSNGLYKCIL